MCEWQIAHFCCRVAFRMSTPCTLLKSDGLGAALYAIFECGYAACIFEARRASFSVTRFLR